MNYTELRLTVSPDYADIFTAELAELGFESFVETDEGLNAYIVEPDFAEQAVRDLIAKYANQTAIAYEVNSLEKKNWNAEWEQSYEPIEVRAGLATAGGVRVRASFHQPDTDQFQYDLVINPKMSFGTGHHETTAMMLEHQLSLDFTDTNVIDVGCGTGILAVMAAKMGARAVVAFDIEAWAVANARENADLNNCPNITVFKGTIADMVELHAEEDPNLPPCHVVLANINRNVLLAEIPIYTRFLKVGGHLLVSGFYETDTADIERVALDSGLVPVRQLTKHQWASIVYQRIK